MVANPRVGQWVRVWYRAIVRDVMPLHGRYGIVRLASRGKPRNHLIEINGKLFVVPCGNLNLVGV